MSQPLRYAGGRRAHGFRPFEELDDFDKSHVAMGEEFIRRQGDGPDLRETPDRWRELWCFYRDLLLAAEIGRDPGRRPAAWWAFDCRDEPAEDEAEVDFLDRIGELSADEIEAIRRKALELVEHDRVRRPDKPADNYIPPSDLHAFAARKGLLTAEERAVLYLDERGRYLGRREVPRSGGARMARGTDEDPRNPGDFTGKRRENAIESSVE